MSHGQRQILGHGQVDGDLALHIACGCLHLLQIHDQLTVGGGSFAVGDLQGGQGDGAAAGIGQDDHVADVFAFHGNVGTADAVVQIRVGGGGDGLLCQGVALGIQSRCGKRSGIVEDLHAHMDIGNALALGVNGKGNGLVGVQVDLVIGAVGIVVRKQALCYAVNEADAIDISGGIACFVGGQQLLTELHILGISLAVLQIVVLHILRRSVNADRIQIEVVTVGAGVVKEGNVSRRDDHGVSAVVQFGALDDGDLVEVITALCGGSPDVVLLIEDHHITDIGSLRDGLGGIVTGFCHGFLDHRPALTVVGSRVLDPGMLLINGSGVTEVGIHHPALVDGIGLVTLIDTAGDKAGLVAGEADKVEARAGKGELCRGPGAVGLEGLGVYMSVTGRA